MSCGCDPWPGGPNPPPVVPPPEGGIYAGGRILFVDPDHPAVQAPGGADPSLPFTLIADALAAAAVLATSATPRTVLCAPGTYIENVSIPLYVFLQGMAGESSGDRGNAHGTTIQGTVTADLATVTGVFDTWAGIADLVVRPPVGQKGLHVTGTGAFRLVASRCAFEAIAGGTAGGAVVVDNSGSAGGLTTEVMLHDCSLVGLSATACPLAVEDGYVGVRGGTIQSDGIASSVIQDGGFVQLLSGVIVIGGYDLNDGYLSCLDEAVLSVLGATAVLDIAATGFALLWSASLSAGQATAVTGTGSLLTRFIQGVSGYTDIAQTLTRYTSGIGGFGGLGLGYADLPQESTVAFQAQNSAGYPGSNTKYVYLRKTTADAIPTAIDLVSAGGGWPVVDDTAVKVSLDVVAYKDAGGTEVFGCHQAALVFRNGAGAVLGAASPQQNEYDNNGGVFTGNVVIGVSGNNITVTITGMAGVTINWTIDLVFRTAGAA